MINLSGDEVIALYELASYALRSSRVDVTDPDVAHLVSAMRKLERAFPASLCRHCHTRPTRRSNGLCDADNAYWHKHGCLAPLDVVEKRPRIPASVT